MDEAARLEKSVWDQNIRPALADRQGWAVLISTPRARNWFFDFHSRGLDPAETLYRIYSFSSLENPYFPREEWNEAKREGVPAPLPVTVVADRLLVEMVPAAAPATVRWRAK